MEVKKKRLEYFQSYIDEKTIQQVEGINILNWIFLISSLV